MSLRPPRLDDRGYDDLVAELVARIPAHTPEWTNPRPGDPGRTLIELFAWLGDALLYRANLIPERQRLAFLRLLGVPLRPARPARGIVTVSIKDSADASPLKIVPAATLSGPVEFEARDEFTVLPVTAQARYKRTAGPDALPPELHQALKDFHNDGGEISTYFTTPLFADGQMPGEGVDVVADTSDRCLWISLLAPQARSLPEQETRNAAVAAALGGQLINVGVVPALPSTDALEPVTARAEVPHLWEITAHTGRERVTVENAWFPEYLALDKVSDTSAGLTRPGILRLQLPAANLIHPPTNDVRQDPAAGVGNRPPRLDDPILASRVIAWIRLRPAPLPPPAPPAETRFNTGQDAPSLQVSQIGAVPRPRTVEHLRLTWVGINAVAVEQLVTRANVIVGESDGSADQSFDLPATSIEPETLVLEVEEGGRWHPWTRVDDLAALDPAVDPAASVDAARDARVFQLDAMAGTLLFGDGIRGRIPPETARIRARQIRWGGGVAGNLPAGTIKSMAATTITREEAGHRLTVAQPIAFRGGAEAETLREAERRIPARLQHRERAVTADDYRAIARETPGVAVGRVDLLPRFRPQTRHADIPGIVTVMALPDRPQSPAPNPRADRPFLEAVHAWLDNRRPLATELYVIGCEYVPVAVSVAVTVGEGAPPETTAQAIKDALRRVLWPLAGGGFQAQGWPLGRALSNRELSVEVARVAGVSEIGGLNLFRRSTTSGQWEALGDSRSGHEQNLALERWQLPELLAVVVVVDDTATGAPLSITEGTVNPFASDDVPLGVPIVPELC